MEKIFIFLTFLAAGYAYSVRNVQSVFNFSSVSDRPSTDTYCFYDDTLNLMVKIVKHAKGLKFVKLTLNDAQLQNLQWYDLECMPTWPSMCNLTTKDKKNTSFIYMYINTSVRIHYLLPSRSGLKTIIINDYWCPAPINTKTLLRRTTTSTDSSASPYILIFSAILSIIVGLLIYVILKRRRNNTTM